MFNLRVGASVIFRGLLLIFLFAVGSYVLVAPQLELSSPPEVVTYQRWWLSQPLSSVASLGVWVGRAALILSAIAVAGLLFFRRWGRSLFAISVCGLLLSEWSLDYPVLKSGLLAAWDSSICVLAGLVLGLVYRDQAVIDRLH